MSTQWIVFTVSTVVIWVALLVAVPVVIAKLPVDYFSRKEEDRKSGLLLFVLRNVLAVILVILGSVFLQGVSVVLLGFMCAEFKGKNRLVRRFAALGWVWKSLCAIRRWTGKPPLQAPRI